MAKSEWTPKRVCLTRSCSSLLRLFWEDFLLNFEHTFFPFRQISKLSNHYCEDKFILSNLLNLSPPAAIHRRESEKDHRQNPKVQTEPSTLPHPGSTGPSEKGRGIRSLSFHCSVEFGLIAQLCVCVCVCVSHPAAEEKRISEDRSWSSRCCRHPGICPSDVVNTLS